MADGAQEEAAFPKWKHVKVRSFVDGNERNGAFSKTAAFTWLSTPYANGSDVFVYEQDSLPIAWNPAKVVSSKLNDDGEIEYVVDETGKGERTVTYTEVAPAKLLDALQDEWEELRKGTFVEVNGQSVLHLNKAIQVDLETYGFIGVTPVTLHFVNCSGETPEHPWLTLFEVNPFAEILSGDTLQTVPKPKPFWNALYYSPGFEGKANAEIRVEGRDKPNDTLQFAAGSLNRFLEQNPAIASKIAKKEDMNTPIFALKKSTGADGKEVSTFDRAKIVAYNIMTNKWAVRYATAQLKEDGTEVWTETDPVVELPVLPNMFAPAIWTDAATGLVRPCLPQKLVEATGQYHILMLDKESELQTVPKKEVVTVPGLQVSLEYQRLSHNCIIA